MGVFMSQQIRRLLSTAVLTVLLVCSSLSFLAEPVMAETGNTQISSFTGSGSAAVRTAGSTRTCKPGFVPEAQDSAVSVRDAQDGTGMNTDVLKQDRLVKSGRKFRCKLSDGTYLKSGWRTFGNKTYYFNKKTYAMTGLKKIGKSWFIFNSKGVLQKGWIKYKKHWYYGSVKRKGKLLTGWQTIGGKRYYISVKKLYRLTGFQYIGKKTYYFNSKGVQQRKNQVIKGKKLIFNSNGTVYSYGKKIFKNGGSNSGSSSGRRFSGKGQQVVDYAVQFVGNPYKWGGSSLTNGCDCSGFVMAVYAHFGISLPHYDAWIRKCGTEVHGLANAQPGDVICYDGHVAIYMGGNRIVHAADYKYGICIWNNAAYRRILSIRRFF